MYNATLHRADADADILIFRRITNHKSTNHELPNRIEPSTTTTFPLLDPQLPKPPTAQLQLHLQP